MTSSSSSPHNGYMNENPGTPSQPQHPEIKPDTGGHPIPPPTPPAHPAPNAPATPPASPPQTPPASQPPTPPTTSSPALASAKEGQTPPPPSQPPQPPNSQPPPAPDKKPVSGSNLKVLWIALIMFIAGVAGGLLLFITYPKSSEKPAPASPKTALTPTPTIFNLPKEAVKIQDCIDGKGVIYSNKEAKPEGPKYIVNKNNVIGLEYEVDQEELANGKVYENLNTFNLKVDHINSGLILSPDSTKKPTRSYIDVFLIDTQAVKSIKCEKKSEPSPQASPSASVTGTSELNRIPGKPVITITSAPEPSSIPTTIPTQITEPPSPPAANPT